MYLNNKVLYYQCLPFSRYYNRLLKNIDNYHYKLATVAEGDPKALFSIATTLRCRGGRYSIPWTITIIPWIFTTNRVFSNRPGYRGSIARQVISKTQKIVLDAALLNTQHYKVRIKGKVEQSREWGSALPYTSML